MQQSLSKSYLDITVHDAHAVTVVQSPEQLIEIATYVIIGQGLSEHNMIACPKTRTFWAALIPDRAA